MDEEDEESRRVRMDVVKKGDEEIKELLQNMDLSWEQRKDLEREQAERKRGRTLDREELQQEAYEVKKRSKKLKYMRLDDKWGEEAGDEKPTGEGVGEETEMIVEFVRNPRRPPSNGAISVITDYFPRLRDKGEPQKMSGDEHNYWEATYEEDIGWFEEVTSNYADNVKLELEGGKKNFTGDEVNKGGQLRKTVQQDIRKTMQKMRDRKSSSMKYEDPVVEMRMVKPTYEVENVVGPDDGVKKSLYEVVNYKEPTVGVRKSDYKVVNNVDPVGGDKMLEYNVVKEGDTTEVSSVIDEVEEYRYEVVNYEDLTVGVKKSDYEVVMRGDTDEVVKKPTHEVVRSPVIDEVEEMLVTQVPTYEGVDSRSLLEGTHCDEVMSTCGEQPTMVSVNDDKDDKVRGGKMVSVIDLVSDDDQDEMEDDWKGIDDEEFLLLTQRMIENNPQTGLEVGKDVKGLVTTGTSLHHHPKTGQVVQTEMGVVPELRSSPPSTPHRRIGEVGQHNPTTMYSQWDLIRDMDRERAFELWTSPSSPLVTEIVKELNGSSMNDQTDQHTDTAITIPGTGVDTMVSRDTGLPSTGKLCTLQTGKPLTLYDINPSLIATQVLPKISQGDTHQGVVNIPVARGEGGYTDTSDTGSKEDDHLYLPTDRPSLARPGISISEKLSQPPPNHEVIQHSDDNGGQAVLLQRHAPLRGMSDKGTPGGSPVLRMNCVYDDKGVCQSHGQGVERFRGGYEIVKGKNGKLMKRYKRTQYFVCDLDMGWSKKLRQTKLSFNNVMTQDDRGRMRRGGRDDDKLETDIPLTSSKVGQDPSCVQCVDSKHDREEVE